MEILSIQNVPICVCVCFTETRTFDVVIHVLLFVCNQSLVYCLYLLVGDLLNNYCDIDPIADVGRIFYALVIMLTYPIECCVTREVRRYPWQHHLECKLQYSEVSEFHYPSCAAL